MESSRFAGGAQSIAGGKPGACRSLRACIQHLRLRSIAAGGDAALNRRTLFVIIPCLDQDIGNQLTSRDVLPPELKGVLESLPALRRYVPVEAPGSLTVVKTRPGPADNQFFGVLRHHCLIELAQVLLPPIHAIRRPTLDPGIKPIESIAMLARQIFIDQQGWMLPFVDGRLYPGPVRMPPGGKNEDYRTPVIGEIGLMAWGVRG